MGELLLVIVVIAGIYLLRDVLAGILNSILDRAGNTVADAARGVGASGEDGSGRGECEENGGRKDG